MAETIKRCIVCGAEFLAMHHQTKLCSPACVAEQRREQSRAATLRYLKTDIGRLLAKAYKSTPEYRVKAAARQQKRRRDMRQRRNVDPAFDKEFRDKKRIYARKVRGRRALAQAAAFTNLQTNEDVIMTAIQTFDQPMTPADISDVPTDTLRHFLADAITMTARSLQRAAMIWRELEHRGEPMDRYRMALAPYMRRIADGTIAAEAVIALAGFRTALDRVALLPPDRQREIVHKRLPVVLTVSNDKPLVVERLISEMTARELHHVISDDGQIVDAARQAEVMRMNARHAPTACRTAAGGARRVPRGIQPKIFAEDGYVFIGPQAVKTEHLIEELKRLGLIATNDHDPN